MRDDLEKDPTAWVLRPPKNITIIGKRGYGKTTFAKTYIDLTPHKNIFINDFLGEYENLKLDETKKQKIFKVNNNIELLVKKCWETEDSLLVLDEIDLYGKSNESIKFIYRYGRHKNISILAISRRFYDLPVIVRALTDFFIIFRITEKRDLEYLKNFLEDEEIENIKNLKLFEYLIIPI